MAHENKIIVAGYPKSGNTWLTRLTSELTESPSHGFLGDESPRDAYSIVNSDISSAYAVYKAHHTLPELLRQYPGAAIIYVVRDVRDIAISASFNFKTRFCTAPDNLFGDLIQTNKHIFSFFDYLFGNKNRIAQMINVLKFGRYDMRWCRVPWDIHVAGFLESDVLLVKYEQLLLQPMKECARILDYLNMSKRQDFIQEAYHRQSFAVTKREAKRQGDQKHEKFLRKGKSGEWKNVLTFHQKNKLYNFFNTTLEKLEYL